MVYKPKNRYSWGIGWKPDIDANIVGKVVEEIEKEHGTVTKELFLEKCRPEDSPTHNIIEWETEKAAYNYQLLQARNIIGALRVVYVEGKDEEIAVKAFVNVSEFTKKAQYRNVEYVLSDDDTREVYLTRIKRELDAYILRNQNIEELADILIEAGKELKQKRRGRRK